MYQRQCAHLQHLFFSFFSITKQFLAKPMTAQNRVYFSVSLQLSIFMWPNSRQQDYTWRVLWLFSCSVVSSSLWPHEPLQHVKFPVLHHLHEFAQTHAHWVDDAIQPSRTSVAPFSYSHSFPASGSFPMSQLFTLGGLSIELQLQPQFFQWIFRVDFL